MSTVTVDKEGYVEWMYPNIYAKDSPRSVLKIDMYHVRAANCIEIEYSSERDGYVIYQTVTVGWEMKDGCYYPIEKRKEKAFIPAWDEEEMSEPEG
jgi:hypothetical protein